MKKTYQLSKHNSIDYIINLKKKKTFLYNFIYFFFEKKLKSFKQYIDKHLIIEFIRFFIFLIDAFILFVKKNENFRLCVNYRNFNLFTIKNRYFLFFIKKNINRFNKIKIYTRLNITIAYYRLKIRKNDK